ncbi:alkaline phosphatase [Planctomicrobium sp. SH664]|uniref:alkaline phosphatase n=1 Tax=Planctomicrobium sp. SH664 TaxID=3448125 RepID=UPI003F5C6CF5
MRWLLTVCLICLAVECPAEDYIRDLQEQAIGKNKAEFGHWGWDPENYLAWSTHSNRLIPVYTFGTLGAGQGIDLTSYTGPNSPYRNPAALKKLYGQVPVGTLNPNAEYLDQTNVFDIQRAALAAGKKHIILVVFDGTDWFTTWAATIHKNQRIAFDSGRGEGLHFMDYTARGTTQYGYMVTSPWINDAVVDINKQTASPSEEGTRGGYAFEIAGSFPWSRPTDLKYLIGKAESKEFRQPYTDSSSSATSMTTGIKTFNASVNVDIHGGQVDTIAHLAQRQGYRIGVVTSVPISHATPASAYGHNVERDDYQDLTRDLLGLTSISHPKKPLPGVDLLIGCGWGVNAAKSKQQGENFIPGNLYLTAETLQQADVRSGGKYVVATREPGVSGAEQLRVKAAEARQANQRLFGFFGASGTKGHLPFQTADGNFNPAPGKSRKAESYTPEDLLENPVLAEMATTALDYLGADDAPFWMMLEAGDVDWANHDNNIDNSIGAVFSGDAAVRAVTDWVEKHSSWDETVMIVTADHGHYLVFEKPELLITPQAVTSK